MKWRVKTNEKKNDKCETLDCGVMPCHMMLGVQITNERFCS